VKLLLLQERLMGYMVLIVLGALVAAVTSVLLNTAVDVGSDHVAPVRWLLGNWN
jgi:hypothetical protein